MDLSQPVLFDPDGEGEVEAFIVECDTSTSPVTTVVHHDQETRTYVNGPYAYNGYPVDITYTGATLQQVRALVDRAYHCSYEIKIECQGVSLTADTHYDGYNHPNSRWKDTTGTLCPINGKQQFMLSLVSLCS